MKLIWWIVLFLLGPTLAAKKGSKGGVGKKKAKKGKRTSESVPAPPLEAGLDEWLGPWWKKRESSAHVLRQALTTFRPVQIRNFLSKDYAFALHR